MSPLYYIVSLALALVLIFSAGTVSETYRTASRYETASEQADTKLKTALEWMTLGIYEGAGEKAGKVDYLMEIAAYHQRRVRWSTWLLFGLAVFFLTLKAIQAVGERDAPHRGLAGHLLGVSAVFLLVGLLAPMLTIVAQQEVALLGRVVLQYESKSIVGTAERLASAGNLAIAGLLFLFSAVIPVFKLLLSFVALSGAGDGLRRAALHTIRFIGKWSMTDVFVVAILLAFFSTESKSFTDASVGPGLYFFAGYGLLSLLGGQVLLRDSASGANGAP
jgi:hypothetical protein